MYPVKIIDKYRWNICWFSYLSKHRIGENLAENKPPTMANEKMTIKSHLFVEASVPSLCSSLLFFRWIQRLSVVLKEILGDFFLVRYSRSHGFIVTFPVLLLRTGGCNTESNTLVPAIVNFYVKMTNRWNESL